MTYFNNDLFTKHLKESFPGNLSRSYAILAPCPFDRLFIARRVVGLFKKQAPDLELVRSFEEETQSDLFIKDRLFFIDEPTKEQFIRDEKVIYTGKTLPFTGDQKKEITTLDLTNEKPWETEKRQKAQLISLASALKKTCDDKLLSRLLKLSDFGAMQNALISLATYGADITHLTIETAEALGIKPRDEVISWKILEATLNGALETPLKESSDFYPLLGQVRYLLQKENNTKALAEVYKVETMARTHGFDLKYLFAYLIQKIRVTNGTYSTS
ncbi:MAG: hypothetical protein SP1CHLAM54_06120 [Chlamydiia bacterium]|nr:hypothetical protein [Chlamydiia bacterium]MCH9615522.1 hypothetical protein [Chlamydiia bacterium]MCH9629177.1 hypothetical protein [Chlamydiia bacterium]